MGPPLKSVHSYHGYLWLKTLTLVRTVAFRVGLLLRLDVHDIVNVITVCDLCLSNCIVYIFSAFAFLQDFHLDSDLVVTESGLFDMVLVRVVVLNECLPLLFVAVTPFLNLVCCAFKEPEKVLVVLYGAYS